MNIDLFYHVLAVMDIDELLIYRIVCKDWYDLCTHYINRYILKHMYNPYGNKIKYSKLLSDARSDTAIFGAFDCVMEELLLRFK
jgi:hypothetical protein